MKSFQIPKSTMSTLIGLTTLGLIILGVGFYVDSHRAWAGLLVLSFFLLSLVLCGGFFVALQFVAGANWSVVLRRVPEVMVSLLPYVGILFVVLFFGIGDLYEWSHKEVVEADPILKYKSGYLNTPFFIVRIIVYLTIWYVLGSIIRNISLKQDKTKEKSLRLKLTRLSAGYLLAFAYFFALASIDLVMSLEPHWYSTMFPIYTFSALAYSGIAGLIILLVTIKKHGGLPEVNEEHFHDLGKFLFMFTVFWAYIAFSQFMLMWYANLPEETVYLEKRVGILGEKDSSWGLFTTLFWCGHFVVPFFILLSRKIKREPQKLVRVAWLCFFMGFVDTVWMVYGGIHVHGFPFSWLECGLFLASVGIPGMLFFYHYGKVDSIPIGDPNLEESLNFHQSH